MSQMYDFLRCKIVITLRLRVSASLRFKKNYLCNQNFSYDS